MKWRHWGASSRDHKGAHGGHTEKVIDTSRRGNDLPCSRRRPHPRCSALAPTSLPQSPTVGVRGGVSKAASSRLVEPACRTVPQHHPSSRHRRHRDLSGPCRQPGHLEATDRDAPTFVQSKFIERPTARCVRPGHAAPATNLDQGQANESSRPRCHRPMQLLRPTTIARASFGTSSCS